MLSLPCLDRRQAAADTINTAGTRAPGPYSAAAKGNGREKQLNETLSWHLEVGFHFSRPLPLWAVLTVDAEYGGEAEKVVLKRATVCLLRFKLNLQSLSYRGAKPEGESSPCTRRLRENGDYAFMH
jgi:hypothetical protein